MVLLDNKAVDGTHLRTGRILGKTFDIEPLEPVPLEIREEVQATAKSE